LGTGTVIPSTTITTDTDAPQYIRGEFTDLDQASWAATAINYLANHGIVSGRDSVTFAPNDNITRAEFAKIVVGAFGIDTGATAYFSDVASDAWYAPYVGACYAEGIITGYEDGTFKPDALVSRQEMAVMVKRAADVCNVALESINEKIDFEDEGSIADYAKDAVSSLQQAGVINGMTATEFAPSETATRAQAAKILYGLIVK
jgi:endo-1,4-beta-xylanase